MTNKIVTSWRVWWVAAAVVTGLLLVSGGIVFVLVNMQQSSPTAPAVELTTTSSLSESPMTGDLPRPTECTGKSATDPDLSAVCRIWFTGTHLAGSASDTAKGIYPDEMAAGTVLAGRWADPDVIRFGDGSWRLYFGEEPETAGASLDIFTATSADRLSWTLANEPVITGGTFPDAVVLADGTIRLAYQSAQTIVSAISADGVTFRTENGKRIQSSLPEDADSVRAPTTIRLADGTFFMVYVGVKQGAPSSTALNQETDVFIAARSTDGLTYTKQGVILNGTEQPFDGFLDGPDLFAATDGTLHLRFGTSAGRETISEAGQYEMISTDNGQTWSNPNLFLSATKGNDDERGVLGGDPTYLMTNDQLLMIFSRREEGLFYKIF